MLKSVNFIKCMAYPRIHSHYFHNKLFQKLFFGITKVSIMFRHIIDLTTAANMENIILTDATLTTTTKCGVQVQYLRMDNVL